MASDSWIGQNLYTVELYHEWEIIMINYRINNKTILVVNSKEIDFKFDIYKVLELKNILIVFLQRVINGCLIGADQPLYGVYAVTQNGKILWNIEQIFKSSQYAESISEVKYFTGIDADKNGNLIVYTFLGVAFVIDIEKEEIIDHFITK